MLSHFALRSAGTLKQLKVLSQGACGTERIQTRVSEVLAPTEN